MIKCQIAIAALIAVTAAGCDKAVPPASEARPVRTVTVEHGAEGEIVSLTGHIRPKDQASLAFRLHGRMIERRVNVGDVLKAGQVVARLDPQIQDNALRSAEANLASMQAVLTQARLTFGRQQQLIKDGWIQFKMKRERFAWVTIVPTIWLVCTVTAGLEKVASPDAQVGFVSHALRLGDAASAGQILAPAKTLNEMGRIVCNDYVDAALVALFVAIVISMVVYGVIEARKALRSVKITAVEIGRVAVAAE